MINDNDKNMSPNAFSKYYINLWKRYTGKDVSAKDMFKMFKGTDRDRAIIAKYCIQDCVLVTKLMEKLQILNNNIGMANVCSVPLSYIFMRGQGPKILSLVAKKCRDMEHLIPKISPKNSSKKPDIPGLESVYHKVKKNKEEEEVKECSTKI